MMAQQNAFVAGGRPVARSSVIRSVNRSGLNVFCRESRVGRVPIVIPKKAQITITGQHLKVKGPLGEFERTFPDCVTFSMYENPKRAGETIIKFKPVDDSRLALSMHGLSRALAANMVIGAAEGFTRNMEMIGTGYRASVAGNELTLNCGYSKPRILEIPKGVTVKVEKQTQLVISGADKAIVGDFCANIRFQRPPEPYKGKGIRFQGERIKLKEGKAAGGKKK